MIEASDPYAHGGVLLDVRTPQETSQGHFPGAVLIPIDELTDRLDEVWSAARGRKSAPILVYCRLGRRAERAAAILRRFGFSHVCNIGGIDAEPLRSMTRGLVQ